MRIDKSALCAAAVALVIASQPAFCLDIASFRYMAPIEVKEAEYVSAVIPPEVYDKANPTLGDLRIVTDSGHEVPYVIWRSAKTNERKKIDTQILNTSYIPQSYTTFTLDMGPVTVRTNNITITTTDIDFVRRITIEGSPDNKTFAVLKKDDYIFDLTTEHNIKNLTVSYPMTDYRFLKVTIWDEGQQPLQNVGGEIYLIEDIRGESATLTSTMKREEKKAPDTTELTLDLSYKNIPSSSVELSVADQNFKREVTILASNEDDPLKYTEVFTTTVYDITTPRFSRKSTLITYPEVQARFLKIIIKNLNNAPLTISNVTVTGVPRKLAFSPRKGEMHRLFFGNPNSKAPSYDIQDIFSYIDHDSIVPVTIQKEIENPGYIPGAELPFTERYPWILWGAVVLMILLLGGIVIRMMRKITSESKT